VLADRLDAADPDCRHGYVKLNGKEVYSASVCSDVGDHRGTNILEIDPFKCTAPDSEHFDTFDSATASASGDLVNYINNKNDGTVLVGFSSGDATKNLEQAAHDVLKTQLGVYVDNVAVGGSFAFIALKRYAKTLSDKAINRAASDSNPARVSGAFTGTMHQLL